MRRREVLQLLASAAAFAPGSIAAQTAAKTYRIGTLTVGPPIPASEGAGKMLVEGLAKRGYRLGENLAYEARGAAGKIPQMAHDHIFQRLDQKSGLIIGFIARA